MDGPGIHYYTLFLNYHYNILFHQFPLATFYFLFYVVFKKNKDMLGWCGIAAVIAANIVIYAYVRMAWYEDKDVADTNDKTKVAKTSKLRTD